MRKGASEHFRQSCSARLWPLRGAVFLALGIVSARLQVAREHAPSPKLRPKPKILAPHRYMISVNALPHPKSSLCLLLLFILAMALTGSLTGCVSPKTVTTVGEGNLPSYRKVYFIPGPEDPREVFPRVISRLREAGFDVTVV